MIGSPMIHKKLIASSPFSQSNLREIGTFSEKRSHMALLLPTGKILVNFTEGTAYHMLVQIAKLLNAEVISIKGTWTFEPDKVEDDENS